MCALQHTGALNRDLPSRAVARIFRHQTATVLEPIAWASQRLCGEESAKPKQNPKKPTQSYINWLNNSHYLPREKSLNILKKGQLNAQTPLKDLVNMNDSE